MLWRKQVKVNRMEGTVKKTQKKGTLTTVVVEDLSQRASFKPRPE